MHKLFSASLAVLISGAALAQAPKLKEEDVVRMALERNEISAITQNQIEQAEIRIKQARSYLFPTLTANAMISKMYVLPEKRLPGGIELRSAEITLSQPIYTFGRLSSGVKIAKLGNEITKNEAKAALSDVVKIAKQLYNAAAFNKTLLKIAEESLANANKNKNALGERVSFGRINQNDNLKMQADVASRKPLLHEATKGYESSIQDLASFLDVPVSELQDIDTNLQAQGNTPLQKKNVETFVDVASAKKNVEVTAAYQDLAGYDYMPTLSAFAQYAPKHSPTKINLPGVLLVDTGTIGLRLDIDIPVGGTKSYEKKVKTIDATNAQLNLKRVKREAEKQQNSLIEQYQTLVEKNKAIKDAADLAEKSYQVALRSFKNGSISQLQLNDSELLLTNNKIAYAQNNLQMKLLKIELERLQTEGRL